MTRFTTNAFAALAAIFIAFSSIATIVAVPSAQAQTYGIELA